MKTISLREYANRYWPVSSHALGRQLAFIDRFGGGWKIGSIKGANGLRNLGSNEYAAFSVRLDFENQKWHLLVGENQVIPPESLLIVLGMFIVARWAAQLPLGDISRENYRRKSI